MCVGGGGSPVLVVDSALAVAKSIKYNIVVSIEMN